MYLALILCILTCVSGTDDPNTVTECVSQEELAEVRTDLERKVDELYSHLHYWQNVTINILKEQYFPSNPGPVSECIDLGTLLTAALDNITQNNKDISRQLKQLDDRLDSIEAGQCTYDKTGSFLNPAHNCSHIVHEHPNATSGYYWLQNAGYAVKVFCDMERVCGCDEGRGESGGWMRVADIDMTRPKESCPSGFRKITSSGKTMCGGQGRTCTSTTFTSHGVPYSRVCGRIIGYQFGTTDVFRSYNINQGVSIDGTFLDGIVLTYGSPRCHIWSFASGYNQYKTDRIGCPCNPGYSAIVPPYIENDYFCDSGYPYNSATPLTYLTSDPLWDGSGCVRGTCCQSNSPPWFCKDFPQYTTEDIELRLCLDEDLSNEDVLIEIVELYVQ